MTIKGFKDEDVMSVYNPILKAYHEVPIVDVIEQLKALGFTEEQAKDQIKKLKEAVA